MLLDEIKRLAALDSTYPRAVEIVRQDRIVELSVTRGSREDSTVLEARVKGNGGTYRTEVAFVGTSGIIYDHSCTCPAHSSYDGLCKHAAAVALTYLERIGEFNHKIIPFSDASSARASAWMPSRTLRSYTSASIERFIADAAKKAQAAARAAADAERCQDDGADPVELVCVLSKGVEGRYYFSGEGMWSLGLKVERGRASYVVKDIDQLVGAWREGRVIDYGKNLSFAHRRSAFTDRANALLDAIAPIVDARRSTSEFRYYTPYNPKTLALTCAQTAEILELMMGAPVIYDDAVYNGRKGRSKKKEAASIVDGDPELRVVIAKDKNGDYEMRVYPDSIECIQGDQRLFMATENGLLRCSEEFSAKMGPLCEAILIHEEALHIRKQDMPGFCAAALPLLQEFTSLSAPADLVSILPPKPEFTFKVGLQDDYVVCAAQVRYGDASVNLFDPVTEGQPVRDVALETAAQQTVRRYFKAGSYRIPDYTQTARSGYSSPYGSYRPQAFYGAGGVRIPSVPCLPKHDDEAYYLLFSEGMRELSHLGEVQLSDRLAQVRVRQAPSVSVKAEASNGLLDIQVEAIGMTPQELASYLSSYRRKQRYVRLSNGDIVRLDGSMQALGDLAEGLGVNAEDLAGGLEGLPANRTLFVDAMLKRAGGVRFERNEGFRRIVRNFETIADADFAEPESLSRVLRPYQTEGFKWLSTLGEAGFGGILADDMGLGKTLQAIAYLLARHEAGEKKPALVVCPASLVYNWISELERFASGLDACAVAGSKKAREELIGDAAAHHVLVTSYDLMKRDTQAYAEQAFSCMILDEAQYIKNSSTKAAKSAKAVRADVRFALTGTPIENRLSELWSIFDFLMPGVLGTNESFGRRFASPIANGDADAARRLQSLVGPFILRRLKGQVLTDLPEKNESVVYASMSGEQEKLYRSSEARIALTLARQMPEEFAGSKLEILAELTKLRQICCDPNLLYENYTGDSAKLETCMELVRSATDGGHKMLLFSQFTSMLEIIEKRLSAEKVGYLKLTGATSKEERVRLVKRFQAGEAPVFLISLKAGGVGLNLTAADIVIHYDPWWNLAAQNQATDRAHRIGQEKEVSVFKLIAKNTIEERIVQMQEKKRDLAESVLGGEAAGSTAITREDILALLDAGRNAR